MTRAGPERRTLRAADGVVLRLAGSPRLCFVSIFLLAFAVRGALLVLGPAEMVSAAGTEVHAVARSLALTGRFADPYAVPTGPTAHLSPVYVGALGLLYRLLGPTPAAEYARCVLAIAAYAAMYASLPWLAGRLGAGAPAGLLGGLAGALLPWRWPLEVTRGWEEPYVAVVLGLGLVAFLRRWIGAGSSAGGSFLLGSAAGAALHLSPSLLPVLLGCVGFELRWRRDRAKWRHSALLAAGVALACVPWGWRNYATFHELLLVRGNLGLELRLGNHEGAAAAWEVVRARGTFRHPRRSREQALAVRELGEAEYMRRAERAALEWIRAKPGAFARLTALRVVHFWCGPLHRPALALGVTLLTLLALLGARQTLPTLAMPQRAALLIPLATYPLLYSLLAYTPRYRVPVDWILLVFAGAFAWRAARRASRSAP